MDKSNFIVIQHDARYFIAQCKTCNSVRSIEYGHGDGNQMCEHIDFKYHDSNGLVEIGDRLNHMYHSFFIGPNYVDPVLKEDKKFKIVKKNLV